MKVNAVPSFKGLIANIKNRRLEKIRQREEMEIQRDLAISEAIFNMMPQFSNGECDMLFVTTAEDKKGNLHMSVKPVKDKKNEKQ